MKDAIGGASNVIPINGEGRLREVQATRRVSLARALTVQLIAAVRSLWPRKKEDEPLPAARDLQTMLRRYAPNKHSDVNEAVPCVREENLG